MNHCGVMIGVVSVIQVFDTPSGLQQDHEQIERC